MRDDDVHDTGMTELLDRAVQRVRALPSSQQDELARILLRLAGDEEAIYRLTPEEEVDLIEAEAEIARGELATTAEVDAVFTKFRP
ncbi:hypothetical protein [Methylobacterium oryzihabitans]